MDEVKRQMTPLQSPKASEPVPIPAYDLSQVINSTPANGIIEVPPGRWPVRCDGIVALKAGIEIYSRNKAATTIYRDPRYPVNNQPVLLGKGDKRLTTFSLKKRKRNTREKHGSL